MIKKSTLNYNVTYNIIFYKELGLVGFFLSFFFFTSFSAQTRGLIFVSHPFTLAVMKKN